VAPNDGGHAPPPMATTPQWPLDLLGVAMATLGHLWGVAIKPPLEGPGVAQSRGGCAPPPTSRGGPTTPTHFSFFFFFFKKINLFIYFLIN
jgi:hypothetical protein